MAGPDNNSRQHWLRIAVIGRNPKVTLARAAVIGLLCLIVFRFLLVPVRVHGLSMDPAYKTGSVNFINRLAYWHGEPKRGDVVGLRLNPNASGAAPSIMYLKRVVGLPGETVAFSNGVVLINGLTLAEPYVKNPCDWNADPVTNSHSQYYVVGDNRSMPQDEHEHGRAERSQIVGKVLF